MHYAAGILPLTWYQGTPLWLLGREARDGTWSDWGGKVEKQDRTGPVETHPANTAAREFYEESMGCVLSAKAMRQALLPATSILLRSRTKNNHDYYCYVVEIPYMPVLHSNFHKVLNFMRFRGLHRAFVEKTDIRWATWEMVQQLTKRPVFEATLAQHFNTLKAIGEAGPEGWKAMCARYSENFEAANEFGP